MKYLKRFFRKDLFVVLIIFVLVLLAYGQTMQMYFLIDDNGLLYKLKNFDKDVWLFGKGIFGEGPYRHIVDQFIPFYPIFGINPTPYFAVGVILYFLASATVYLFFAKLTKNRLLAFSTAAIFASGYVGSETMFGIVNSWQAMRGIIMALSTFGLFYKFIETKKILFYGLALLLFFLSLDTVYPRAHGLIFPLLLFDFLFWPVALRFKALLNFVIRQLPFVLVYYHIYLSNTVFIKSFKIFSLAQDVFLEENFLMFFSPLANLGNLFIPDLLTSRIDSFVSQFVSLPVGFYLGSTLAGLLFCVLAAFLFLRKRSEAIFVKLLIFSVVWIVSNMMLFFARETNLVLHTAHRYFSYSLVGLSLFWGLLSYFLSDKGRKIYLFALLNIAVIFIYLALGMTYQYSFNINRSIPAHKLFADFDKAVPNIPDGAVIYFDLANNNRIKGQFGSFFGGMFSEASNFALYSEGVDFMTDFIFTYKFNDVVKMLQEKTTSVDKVFTFYYGNDGLVDTTEQTRRLLVNGKVVTLGPEHFFSDMPFEISGDVFKTGTYFSKSEENTIGGNPLVAISVPSNTLSLVPSQLSFSMKVTPKTPTLPYETKGQHFDVDGEAKNRIFFYLLSKSTFQRTAEATAASFWKEEEPKFAIDGRLETSWRGHRGYWDDIDRGITDNIEYFQVDMRRILDISQVMWVSSQKPLVPIHYRILTSINGTVWDEALEVRKSGTLPEGTVVFDSFSPKKARFVKMEILKTYGNDGPEIKEFEAIETQFTGLDQKLVENVKTAPFSKIENLDEYRNALSFVRQNATFWFYWMADSDTKQDAIKYLEVPIHLDGGFHEYTIQLPVTGISWTRFTIEGFNFPADIAFRSAKIIYTHILQ